MKLINPKTISPLINRCYLEYDPTWVSEPNSHRVNSFKYYIERTAGLKLDFEPKIDKLTFKQGYELHSIEVVDDKKYTMFLLRYSK